MTSKRYLSLLMADVRVITILTARKRGYVMSLKASNETNNCLQTSYRSKFTAASRGFPATTRLSCLFTDPFTCRLAMQNNNYNLDCFRLSTHSTDEHIHIFSDCYNTV